MKNLSCALLFSLCRFKCAQKPCSGSKASLLKGAECYSEHNGCANLSSGDTMKDEKN